WLQILPEPIRPGHLIGTLSSHHRHRGCTDPEERGVGILDPDAYRKARGEMHPIERLFDIGEAGGDLAILRKDSISDAFHNASKFAVWVFHQEHIDMAALGNVPQFRFPVVCDYPPGARVHESKHWTTRTGIGALRNVQVGYVRLERCDYMAALEIQARAV